MRALFLGGIAALLAAVAGCAGIGVVETSDPAVKLRQAGDLIDPGDRALLAERLIAEALETYQSKNDELGLAEAYRLYGNFYISPSVEGKWREYYLKNGFLDKSVNFSTRHQKAVEYYEKARLTFAEHKRYGQLVNVEYNLGFTHARMGNPEASCKAFERAVAANNENLRQNPGAKPFLPKGYSSFETLVAEEKRRLKVDKCGVS